MAKKTTEVRMDRTILKRWVKMLRSGDYKQGQGSLRPSADTHCCLAVLADAVGAKWRRSPRDDHRTFPRTLSPSHYDCTLPPRLLKQVGLSVENQNKLVDYNDEKGWSFKRIATWSEKNL